MEPLGTTASGVASETHRTLSSPPEIRFPHDSVRRDQDEEWFEVKTEEGWQRLRLHDYGRIFRVPGLYEEVVYNCLRCRSPQRLVQLLELVLENWPISVDELRVLDLGAGNGIVGAELRKLGVARLVGVDILPEAKKAANRDRPQTYDDYRIADLCKLPSREKGEFEDSRLNTLTSVAALGFGDIPPSAFAAAFNLLTTPGWLAMTIHERFLDERNRGFGRLFHRMTSEEVVRVEAEMRICHRRSVEGERLFYRAIIGRKLRDVPKAWYADNHHQA